MFLFCCVLIFVSINPPFDSLLFQKHFRQNRWISVDVVSRQLNCVNVYYSQKHSDGTNYTRWYRKQLLSAGNIAFLEIKNIYVWYTYSSQWKALVYDLFHCARHLIRWKVFSVRQFHGGGEWTIASMGHLPDHVTRCHDDDLEGRVCG